MFVNRVKSLPVMHDALSLASSLYHTTKDKQYVGVAVQVAAVAVGATASKALSLASPLVEQGGRWAALDELACKGLDCVKQAVPIITKPTKEIVSITRNVALSALAGVNTSVPPPTIGAALASRTTRMMWCVAESKGGRVALSTAGSLLDTAHIYLDTYLPPAKVDLYNSDGQDGPLGVKMVALSNKTRRRFKRCVHTRLNVNCNQDLDDDDDIIITSGHLLELGRRSLLNWHHHMSQLHYTLLVTGIANRLSTLVMDRVNTMHTAVVHGMGIVHTLAKVGVGQVLMMVTSDRADLVMVGGFHMVIDVVGNTVCFMNKAVARGVELAHIIVINGRYLSQRVRKDRLDVVCAVTVMGDKMIQCRMMEVADMAGTVLAGGMGIAHEVVMKSKGVAHSFTSRSRKTIKQIASFIHPTVTSLALFEYAHLRAVIAHLKTQQQGVIDQVALGYAWVIPEVRAWLASLIHLHLSSNHKVHEE